MTQNLPCLVSN